MVPPLTAMSQTENLNKGSLQQTAALSWDRKEILASILQHTRAETNNWCVAMKFPVPQKLTCTENQENSSFLRLFTSVKLKRRWEGVGVHFLSLNLCKVIILGEGQTPLSPDICQVLLCRSTSTQRPHGLALVDYSKPESEKNYYQFVGKLCSELQQPPLLLIFYTKGMSIHS